MNRRLRSRPRLLLPGMVVVLAAELLLVTAAPSPALAQDDSLVRPGKRHGGGAKTRPGGGAKTRPGGGAKTRPAPAPPPQGGEEGSEVEAGVGGDEAARNRLLIERYLGVLESQPGEQFALSRLMELYRAEHGTLAPLLEQFEQRVASDPQAYSARMVLGELYRRGGRATEGMRFLREAAEIRPNDPAPRLAIARAAEELGQADEAHAALEEALRLSRGDDRQEVLRQLRDAALGRGGAAALEEAQRLHEELVRATGNSLYVQLELGQELARLDRHAEALDELDRVLRRVRGDARAQVPVLREIAQSQIALDRQDDALATLQSAMRLTAAGSGERAELMELMVDVYRRRDALPELVDLLEREGGSGFERAELLGRLSDELAMAARAERWYRAALAANARHVDTRVRLIRLLVRLGRVEEATREYETLVQHAPREPRFVVELAEMYLRIGQRDRAMELLARAGRTNPSDVALHGALLDLYGNWGEDDLALEEARILARIDPHDERHLVELGERYFQAGDRERALATWRRIPLVAAERWEGLAALADVYGDHDMGQEALGLYEEALRLRPDEPSVLRRMAGLMERLGRWSEAIQTWERVIAASPEQDVGARREARTRIVTIWSSQRRLQTEVPRLQARFGGTPPDVEAGRFLYEALERMSRLPEATAAIRRVIELRRGDVEARLALERILVRQGDVAGAIDVLRELLELEPRRSRELYTRLASYSMQLQRDAEALEYAAQALALNPDDAQGHFRLAQLYRQQGNPERATVEYRRAIELDDRLYDAYLELAELHETRSQTQDAIQVYLRLLSKAPDDALVARAGRQALLLSVMDGSVAQLEHDLLPMALAHTERVVYRQILVALYGNLTWSLIQAAAYGRGEAADRALEQLRGIGQRSLQPLLDALLDADPEQQEAAVSMLGHLANPSAAVPLVAYATGEGSPGVRARALVAAGQVGDERVVASLVGILDGSGDVAQREAAAFGLGRIGTPAAIAALRRHLESPIVSIRALACVGLARSRDARDVEPLVRRLTTDDTPLVRAAAAWALGFSGGDEATPQLARALRSGPPLVRRAATWALGARDDERARRELAEALFDEDAEIRAVAAWALRRAGAGPLQAGGGLAYHRMPDGQLRIGSYLDDLLRTPADDGSALAALTRAGGQLEAALDHALGGQGHPRLEQVIVALRALEAGDDRQLLLAPLVRPEEVAADDVREALGPIVAIAVRRARALLEHRSAEVRSLAAATLGLAGGDAAVDGLLLALADEDEAVRAVAMEQLGRLGTSRAAAPLAQLLDADRWSARARVVRTLGGIVGPESAAALSGVLRDDPSATVRLEAAGALGRQGRDAIPALTEAADRDADPHVRAAACRSLDLVGTPCGRPEAGGRRPEGE